MNSDKLYNSVCPSLNPIFFLALRIPLQNGAKSLGKISPHKRICVAALLAWRRVHVTRRQPHFDLTGQHFYTHPPSFSPTMVSTEFTSKVCDCA